MDGADSFISVFLCDPVVLLWDCFQVDSSVMDAQHLYRPEKMEKKKRRRKKGPRKIVFFASSDFVTIRRVMTNRRSCSWP